MSHPGMHIMSHPGIHVNDGAPSHQSQLTRVNGIGMWNSWTRNFPSPLLALLDLLDNSFDAALKPTSSASSGALDNYKGALHIEPDKYHPPPQVQQQQFSADPVERTTGILILNNSCRPIKSIERILEVYSSAKGRDNHGEKTFSETVGENGVGLKQGCATLSDLSFVLSRNDGKLSLGVIAASLQKEEGIYLPSFHFQSEEETQLRREMRQIFKPQHLTTVGQCVEQYGDGSLSAGIGRLAGHFATMKAPGTWGEEKHVFCVVLHNLRHGHKTETETAPATGHEEDVTLANTLGRAGPSGGTRHAVEAAADPHAAAMSESAEILMRELRDELPHNYIHVPNDFNLLVDGVEVKFCFWQRRLVEMSEFTRIIDGTTPFTKQPNDWRYPNNGYPIRILCGFDPTRPKGEKYATLLIYSRQSGRLIKTDPDCRALLNLNSGGTVFSQGFTIVVDDQLGNLPLNPTKNDVAFGEQANGSVHKRNLYGWIGAVANFYYNVHYKKYGESRTIMSAKIDEHSSKIPADASNAKPIEDSSFTTYEDITWFYNAKTGVIRTKSYKTCKEVQGEDTMWRLEASSAPPSSPKKRKRIPVQNDDDVAVNFPQDDDDIRQDPVPGAGLESAVAQAISSQGQSPSRSARPGRVKERAQAANAAESREWLEERVACLEKAYDHQKAKKKKRKDEVRKYYDMSVELELQLEEDRKMFESKIVALERNLSQKSHSPNGVRELEQDDNISKLAEALAAEKEMKKEVMVELEQERKLVAELTQNTAKEAPTIDKSAEAEVARLKRELDYEREMRVAAESERGAVESERDAVRSERDAVKRRIAIMEVRLTTLSQD